MNHLQTDGYNNVPNAQVGFQVAKGVLEDWFGFGTLDMT
jgi:hypothetical protein